MRYIPTRALIVSGAALVTAAAMLLFSTGPATAAVPKQVTITSGPTVTDNSVSLGYSINRWPRAIRSRVCTVDTATTRAFVPCGALTKPAANPTNASVTLTGLADGTYTFTVRVRFKDGRHAAATSAPFTIDTDLAGTCFENEIFSPDLLYLGPINTVNNAVMPCDAPAPNTTVVQGSDLATLEGLCQGLGLELAYSLRDVGIVGAPADWHVCD